jgi:nucleoside 2-deoxyribosyltransferase
MRVYLAGPDVFLPDPLARAAALKAVCARYGLEGVFPLDALPAEPTGGDRLPEWQRIALRNEAHIRSCAALIANLTPFRGPSADVGTVFELGFARALGRPVFGWSGTAEGFLARSRRFLDGVAVCGADGVWRDGEGLLLEAFGCRDNLMIDGAVIASGGALEAAELPPERRWTDLSAFERCVSQAARALGRA